MFIEQLCYLNGERSQAFPAGEGLGKSRHFVCTNPPINQNLKDKLIFAGGASFLPGKIKRRPMVAFFDP